MFVSEGQDTLWVFFGRVEKTTFSPGQDRFKTGLLIIASGLVLDSTRNKSESDSGSSHTAKGSTGQLSPEEEIDYD